MRIYEDPYTNDEIVSDAYTMTEKPEIGALEFVGTYIDVPVDPDDSSLGTMQVIDIPHNHNLQQVPFKRNQFLAWTKVFMPKRKNTLQENDPSKVAGFMDAAKKYVTHIANNFANFDFYVGQSGDPDSVLIACYHNEEGTKPYFLLLKDACDDFKC